MCKLYLSMSLQIEAELVLKSCLQRKAVVIYSICMLILKLLDTLTLYIFVKRNDLQGSGVSQKKSALSELFLKVKLRFFQCVAIGMHQVFFPSIFSLDRSAAVLCLTPRKQCQSILWRCILTILLRKKMAYIGGGPNGLELLCFCKILIKQFCQKIHFCFIECD